MALRFPNGSYTQTTMPGQPGGSVQPGGSPYGAPGFGYRTSKHQTAGNQLDPRSFPPRQPAGVPAFPGYQQPAPNPSKPSFPGFGDDIRRPPSGGPPMPPPPTPGRSMDGPGYGFGNDAFYSPPGTGGGMPPPRLEPYIDQGGRATAGPYGPPPGGFPPVPSQAPPVAFRPGQASPIQPQAGGSAYTQPMNTRQKYDRDREEALSFGMPTGATVPDGIPRINALQEQNQRKEADAYRAASLKPARTPPGQPMSDVLSSPSADRQFDQWRQEQAEVQSYMDKYPGISQTQARVARMRDKESRAQQGQEAWTMQYGSDGDRYFAQQRRDMNAADARAAAQRNEEMARRMQAASGSVSFNSQAEADDYNRRLYAGYRPPTGTSRPLQLR